MTATRPPSSGRFDRVGQELVSGGTQRPPADPDDDAIGGTWAGRLAGLAIIGLFVWLAFVSGWMFLFAVGILISVFLHETGHFVTARWTGMKATQFFLGFGPRLWSFRRGETEYGVRLLPLGAFVKIIGMSNIDDVPPADEARTYRQQSFPKRMLVITAGSLMHMAIAIVLLFSVFATKGQLEEVPGAEVGAVSDASGAAAAGILADDIIVRVEGVDVEDGDVGALVRTHEPGDSVTLDVVRDGEVSAVDVVLGANPHAGPNRGTAFLGVSAGPAADWQEMSLPSAAVSSVTELFPTMWESTKGVVKVLNPVNIWNHVAGDENADLESRPTTVVGVTQISDSIGASEGLIGVLYLLAMLNVFVGVFNMFPLLPLDGGHAAIATYERVREGRTGRRYFVDIDKLMPLAMGVIAVLLVLFMSGLYLDIAKPLR